ncbi:MAG: hypothetical protein HOQ24_06400 [Mycobacteriaceae bacterium]|nr:hypothetical protein [Mycobacteriaceae bacterium]
MAETKVEELLDATLDAEELALASEEVRATLSALWNAEGSRMRTRLLDAMHKRAESHQHEVTTALRDREAEDIARARGIFANFRRTLTESIDRLTREIDAEQELLTLDLPDIARAQQEQRRTDLRRMNERRISLDEEELREVDAIRERYADVKPHISAVAVVFALTPTDAQPGALR